MSLLVMKFGGASVAQAEQFALIAEIVLQRKKEYAQVIVVISAMGNTTDQLIALAKTVNPQPPSRELDMLISAGERISVALLAMALAAKGAAAKSFTGSQSGIITTENHSQAQIVEVRPHRLIRALNEGHIVLVAGFQGMSRAGEITTLGRGGSDTSAVALAVALGAEKVEFFKDVPGIFSADPKQNKAAQHLSQLSYAEAKKIVAAGAKVLHDRSILLAEKNQIVMHVLPFNEYQNSAGTVIGQGPRLRENFYEA